MHVVHPCAIVECHQAIELPERNARKFRLSTIFSLGESRRAVTVESSALKSEIPTSIISLWSGHQSAEILLA